MALMQHPIIGDQRYTYAYRKQYAQHHPEVVCHDEPDWWRAPDVDDDSNSAFVALRRWGLMLACMHLFDSHANIQATAAHWSAKGCGLQSASIRSSAGLYHIFESD